MKWKKLFALALAGVMALALLTGCSGSGGKSEDRLIEENLGSYFKDTTPDAKVSYNIPELTKTIAPDFSPEEWYDETGLRPEKYAFLQETLKDYAQNGMTLVDFYAFDATGYDTYVQSLIFSFPGSFKRIYGPQRYPDNVEWTEFNIAVCHKTINGRNYCLGVIVESYKLPQTVIQ